MSKEIDGVRFRITHMNNVEAVACPCGSSKRAFAEPRPRSPQNQNLNQNSEIASSADAFNSGVRGPASLHVVEIKQDSAVHYHKAMTEIYYVLEGEGVMELDGAEYTIGAGSTVLIEPGCRHRAVGDLKIVNVAIPAFDPADEWFD